MNRSDCHAALSALLDEWLNPSLDSERRQEVRREVERVISQYPEGESEWRGLLELENTLRAMPTVSTPPRIRSNVRAALTAETAPRPRRIWSLNALTWVGSATFAMLVLWIVARPFSNQPPTIVMAPVQQESPPTTEPTLAPKRPNPAAKNHRGGGNQRGGNTKNAAPAKASTAPTNQGKAAPSRPTPQTGSLAAPQRTAPQSEDRIQEKQSAQSSNTMSAQVRRPESKSADSGRLGQMDSREMAPSMTRPKALESRPAPSSKNGINATSGRLTPPTVPAPGGGFSYRQGKSPKLAMPSPKSAEAANPNPSPMRMRSAMPDMQSNRAQTGYDDDWARTNLTFTMVTLPANRGFLPAPALGAAPSADMARNAPSATLARPLPPRARAVSPMRVAPGEAPGPDARAQEPAPMGGFAPSLKAAPPAPSIVVPSAPTPEIAPAPVAPITPPVEPRLSAQENRARVFTVPPTAPRRFRVTIQTPRTLGPARARLEGDGVPANSPPIWQGTLEEQRPVTIDAEAVVSPGQHLNLVVEQIRPNGESGEQKTFPLVRP